MKLSLLSVIIERRKSQSLRIQSLSKIIFRVIRSIIVALGSTVPESLVLTVVAVVVIVVLVVEVLIVVTVKGANHSYKD